MKSLLELIQLITKQKTVNKLRYNNQKIYLEHKILKIMYFYYYLEA